MNIKNTLRKEGIDVIKKLDILKVNSIAQKITNTLCLAFPEHVFSRTELFANISRLDMYLAKMTDSLCGAKYFYKNKSIYFNIDYPLSEISFFSIHECLHYLQEVVDDNGNLIRLGLYDFARNHGMALNEAAVQLMTVEALNKPISDFTYYNLHINSRSQDYYPLECAIVKQMSYFTGTYPLYYSTLHGNDVFKNTFIAIAGENTFFTVEKNLDKILELEDELSHYSDSLKYYEENSKKINKINSIISHIKKQITNLFFASQNIIISSCFSRELENIRTLKDVTELKNKLYNFQHYIATNDNYTFYNEFYRNMMESLECKTKYIEENGEYDFKKILTSDITVISNAKKSISILRRMLYKLGFIENM